MHSSERTVTFWQSVSGSKKRIDIVRFLFVQRPLLLRQSKEVA